MTFTIDSTLAGIHSRSELTVRTSRDYDRGRTTRESLHSAFESDAVELVDLQLASGITRISDGQLLWQDLLRPFSESLVGLKIGADLSRWYDTNTFYKKPSIVKRLSAPKERSFMLKYVIKRAFDLVKTGNRVKRKLILPGPYTLASLVTDGQHTSRVELVEEFARILKMVVRELAALGFGSIQINEPSLVYRYGESALTNKRDLKAFISAFEEHLSRLPVEVSLHTYFGDCSKILKSLVRLGGVASLGIDFTQTSLSSIKGVSFGKIALACGCVDGRNSLIESPQWISGFCMQAIRALKPKGIVVQPSCELKYLPRFNADQKIRSIGEACKLLEGKMK